MIREIQYCLPLINQLTIVNMISSHHPHIVNSRRKGTIQMNFLLQLSIFYGAANETHLLTQHVENLYLGFRIFFISQIHFNHKITAGGIGIEIELWCVLRIHHIAFFAIFSNIGNSRGGAAKAIAHYYFVISCCGGGKALTGCAGYVIAALLPLVRKTDSGIGLKCYT